MTQANDNQLNTLGSNVLRANVKAFNDAGERLLHSLKAVECRLIAILPEPFQFRLERIQYKSNILTSRDGAKYGPGLIYDPAEPLGHPLPPEFDRAGDEFHFNDDPHKLVRFCTIEEMWIMARRLPEMIHKISEYLTRSADQFNESVATLDAMAAAMPTEPAEKRCPVCGSVLKEDFCTECGTPANIDPSLLVICPFCDKANNPRFPTCYHCQKPIYDTQREVRCECTTLEILEKIGGGRYGSNVRYGFCPVCNRQIGPLAALEIADPKLRIPPIVHEIKIDD